MKLASVVIASLTATGIVAIGALGFVDASPPQVSPVVSAPSDHAFLVMLGEKATASERWDGTVRVDGGGTVESTVGWHFSADDKVTGPGAWTSQTRRDEILPFAEYDYAEIASGERPKIFYFPVGVYVTVSGP